MKKTRSALSCKQCGAKNFPYKGALIGYQLQGRCSVAAVVRSQINRVKELAPLQGVTRSTFAYASACEKDDFDLMNVEFETPIDIEGPLPDFDSNLQLIQFIKICRNLMGLLRADTNSVLFTLFHLSFKMEEVTLRNWQDIEKYEAKKYDDQDVSSIHKYFQLHFLSKSLDLD